MITIEKERLIGIKKDLLRKKPSNFRHRSTNKIKKQLTNLSELKKTTITHNNSIKGRVINLRSFSTISNESHKKIDLIQKLNHELQIEFENVDNKTHDLYLKHMIAGEGKLYNNIHDILNDQKTTLEEKQIKLESLTHQTKEYKVSKDFSLPNKLKPIIEVIDFYIYNKNDPKFFLPYQIVKSLSQDLSVTKKQNMTETKKTSIQFLILGLRLFIYQNKSFGFFLCSALVLFLRNRSKQMHSDEYTRKLILNFENNDFAFKRTELISHLITQFTEFIKASKSIVEENLLLRAIEKTSPEKRPDKRKIFTIQEKIDLVQASLPLKEAEFFSFILKDPLFSEFLYEKTERSGIIQSEIAISLLVFLESVGLIIDEGDTLKQENTLKTPGLVKLSEKYVSSIFEIPFSPCNLPLVARPKFWKIDEKNPKRNFGWGGFFYNEKLNVGGLHSKKNEGMASLTPVEIESINYIQSNIYKINRNYLELIKTYPFQFIYEFMKNKPEKTRFFNFNYSTNKLTIVDISTYLESDPDYAQLKANLPRRTKNKTVYKRLLRQKERVQTEYFTLVNLLMEFIHIYCIADLFKDIDFFFSLAIDGRGRFYYSSAGGGFGLQTGSFSNNLIELQGNCYKEPIYLPCVNQNKIETILESSEEKIMDLPRIDFYSEIKQLFNINSTCVGIDATGSGTSIISGLIGFKRGLVWTNVITETELPTNKCCPYTMFQKGLIQKMEQDYEGQFNQIFSNKFIKKQGVLERLPEEKIREKLLFIFSKIELNLLTREHVKQFVMCQNYAQMNKGRSDYIFNFFIRPLVALDDSENFTSKDYKFLRNISFALAQWVEKNYKECFPELHAFCSIMRTRIDYEKPLLLTVGKVLAGTFKIKQIKYRILRTFKPSFKENTKNKKHEISYFIPTKKINKLDASRASVANFIHFLDSRLCTMVINKCMENGVILWTNHDCFYTTPNKFKLVKKFYFQSFKELLLENDSLVNFFNANQIKNIKKVNEYLKETNSKSKLIRESIKAGKLTMSEHILS